MDRTIAPEIKNITSISFQEPEIIYLANKATLYAIRKTEEETAKIDFVFNAGSLQTDNLIAGLTAGMLFSGTDNKSSTEINEEIDSLGGYTGTEASSERMTVSIVGLKEYIVQLTEMMVDAVLHVNFDSKELTQLIQNKKKKFQISIEKVSTVAKREFVHAIFEHNPYGRLSYLEDYDQVKREDLISFHQKYILEGLDYVTIVGALTDSELQRIQELALKFKSNKEPIENYNFQYRPNQIIQEKEGAVQTAIRIGRVLFNKTQPDYKQFMVLNTILGGYFGSRLMSSIREDKGYTYGINSGISQNLQSGYFYIATEVNKKYRDATIQAIQEEIKKLQNELVGEDELSLVKNYIIGEILEQSDGPQAMMDRFISVQLFGMNLSYYNDLMKAINEISAKEIQQLAQKYLDWEDMVIVAVG